MKAKEASAVLGVALRTVYSLAAPNGPIRCTRIGKRVIFAEQDIKEYQASCQFTEINRAIDTALNLTGKSKVGESGLLNYFRQHGLDPKRTTSIKPKQRGSTPEQRATTATTALKKPSTSILKSGHPN